ncbi:MAG: thiamine pyrophosphate-binding protein [SAR202 cluster bacterium]|nr:thiamine pyrophosphate-binding protein [SAR202 cluster bacterium]MQG42365.1 thiamine pyrophosphate-binding protein [SAR202 cluster bacterium]|tara:strand:- start:1427 stop:1996 length:570 start_codon:yes stop_codon:yes gene_type:complete
MLRADALKAAYPRLKNQVTVTIMGAVAVELYNLGHQPNFFYLEHGMGLASSMGLGLAVSLPKEKVAVLDGDGSVLMNLGTLSTLARYRPPNLTHWIFDNESLLSVGGFPTATGTGTDLAGIAEKAGAEHVALADTVESAEQAFAEASERYGLSIIVSKVEAIGPPSFAMDINLLENRFEFARHMQGLAS